MPNSGGTTGTLVIYPPAGSAVTGGAATNLLPLENFRRILSFNPFHFWGLANAKVPITSACNGLVTQHSWQAANAAGRSEIIEAIGAAEASLLEYLGYAVAPRYVSKTLPWPHYFDARQFRVSLNNAYGLRTGVYTEGHIQAVGIESLTEIGTTAITLSDEDGDGLTDTFTTGALATAVTDPSEIAVYFILADRLDGEVVSERWRVLPVQVTISGGNVIVKGKAWTIVRPVLYEGVGVESLDPDDTTIFAAQLILYQRTTDPDGETLETSQGVLLWDTEPCHGEFCWCGLCSGLTYDPTNSAYDPAAVGMAVARVGIRDKRYGEVLPASALRSATTGLWYDQYNFSREPDRVTVRLLAGYPLDSNGEVSRRFQTIVTRLALAELGLPICGCQESNREAYRWQFDVARAAGANDEQYSISPADLDNPFGTRRGQVWAWKQVRNLRLTRGLSY